jgi:hypothetical protein
VHCFAYKQQLPLVAASREVKYIHQFFVHLTSIINIVVSSSKSNDELKCFHMVDIESMVAFNEIKTGMGKN